MAIITTTLLQTVDNLLKELRSLRPLNNMELKRLREEFAIETTYNSNAIEGNTLTLRETAMILQEGITIAQKPLKDHLDIIGYKDAFNYIMDAAAQNIPLTEHTIKIIHSLVLMNDAENRGVYRNVPVRILGAVHTPPQPYRVAPSMEGLIADYGKWLTEQPVIEAIARLHLEFESIHPFIDGNGRTGRLILNLELVKHGFLPVDIKFTDRARYYECFDRYHTHDHDPEDMVRLIATYEKSELERYIDILQSLD